MTTTIEPTTEAVPPPPPARRRRWRLWAALGAVVVLVAAGVITWVSVAFHYLHAAPLECACGLGWARQEHVRNEQAGPYSAMVVKVRPGQAQSFYVLVANRSSVTQTILPRHDDPRLVAEAVSYAVARPTGTPLGDQDDPERMRYTPSGSIAPGGLRYVRVTVRNAPDVSKHMGRGGSIDFDALYLRVRVGAYTRSEVVDFMDTAFVIAGR